MVFFLVFTFGGTLASYLGLLCASLGLFCAKTNKDIAREHLSAAINYKKDGDVEKMLEYSLKAYDIDKNEPDVIFYAAYSYLCKGDLDSNKKAKEILISNSNKLGDNEKALKGVVEKNLGNYTKSFQLFKELNLYMVSDEILPWTLIAFTDSAFKSQSYTEAVSQTQLILEFLDRKVEYFGLKLTPDIISRDRMTANFHLNWFKFASTKLQIGHIWLAHAYETKQMNHWYSALKIANEGFITFNSVNKKDNILNFLFLFNELLKNEQFVKSYGKLIEDSIGNYIDTLEKMKNPSYVQEIHKLKLLNNSLADTYNLPITKYDISIEEETIFYLGVCSKDDSGIKTITLKKNFISNDDLIIFENGHPQKELSIKKEFAIKKGTTFNKEDSFYFQVIAEDIYSNVSKPELVMPNFFYDHSYSLQECKL